jgi:hypothetical protein
MLLSASMLLLVGVSSAVGSLRIVEAVMVSPELDTVAHAQLTPSDTGNESTRTIVGAPVPMTVSPTPRNASMRRAVTTARQSPPDAATSVHTSAGTASDDSPTEFVHTPVAAATLAEAASAEKEDAGIPVESIAPQVPPPGATPAAPEAQRVTPWTAAADAGVTLGQRSKEGGIATARFFSRFGKRIADSF